MTAGAQIVAAHLFFAVILFFLINWIGSHSTPWGYMQLSLYVRAEEAPAFNFVFRILTPVVFIVIIAAGLYLANLDRLTTDIFLVVVYYFLLRGGFNMLIGRTRLLNWRLQGMYFLLSSALAYFAYWHLIVQRNHLLPDFKSMSNQLWIVIFGYLYLLFNNLQFSTAATQKAQREILAPSLRDVSRKVWHDRLGRNE